MNIMSADKRTGSLKTFTEKRESEKVRVTGKGEVHVISVQSL